MVCDNIVSVIGRIEKAELRAGRKGSVKLVAVCKGFPYEKLKEAYECGLRVFGENRVQEAGTKIERARSDGLEIEWHMIGHLQTNKAKRAVELFDWIESVDSLRLAEKISGYAEAVGKRVNVLLEVNISGEPQKSGFSASELMSVFPELNKLGGMRILGLMGIAPNTEDVAMIRSSFARLRRLREEINERYGAFLRELSMGMTNDFEIAIEEGSTIVRIGRAIFGERNG